MSKPLVVVESPTKVRTIEKYLGKEYKVAATLGHIKDLPNKELGIDVEHGFKPDYITIPGKQKIIANLKKAATGSTDIYLAPDPDREGEAIAWHTAEILEKKGRNFHRVLFHELTKNAIHESMKHPEPLHSNKYEAQQARRILDRLVGYLISPLLWKKVKSGLSAGRVQSVAVRLICERERAIQAFVPVEYWSITAHFDGPPPFSAALIKKNNQKIEIPDEQTANRFYEEISGTQMVVDKITRKTTRRNPSPPFTTSTLQQEAIRKLRFSAKKTMLVAQQLYEGIELGPGEPVGLITYMRTDSVRISQEAALEAMELIRQQFGEDYAVKQPRAFKNKKKVQDAHEAIRPSSVLNTPEQIAPYLTEDQQALYKLIWQRFIASQMAQALIDLTSIFIQAGEYLFQARGSIIRFPGFMVLYIAHESNEDGSKDQDEKLPEFSEGTVLPTPKIEPKQHFTQPPPKFSEASLVKELEDKGIGRPSTYATILSTIRDKGYVELEKGYFHPSELGFIVNDLVTLSFPDVFDVEFTARMEDDLDRVESAEVESLKVLEEFYKRFKTELDQASETMLSMKHDGFPTTLECPKCKRPIHVKMGKNGHFLACSGYPECDYSCNYTRDEKGNIVPVESIRETDKVCEKCGRPMLMRQGKYGMFLACSGYPECKSTQSVASESGAALGVKCPVPGCDGELKERKSKRGKTFYGCNKYPKCTFASWDKPVNRKCPDCGSQYLVEKTTKREGTFLACPEKECGFKEFA